MTFPDMSSLIQAARDWARGSYAIEAAVELLIQHDVWLNRSDFRRMGIQYTQATYTSTPYAVFSWDTLHSGMSHGLLPCSNSEAAILRIALSLADGHPVDLGPAVTRLDRTNLSYVLAAIRHASGDRSAWITTEGNAR
jgi:hypothetical protein